MHSYLKKLTPLHFKDLEIFLGFFLKYFEFKFDFFNLTGRNRLIPLPVRAGMTGNRGFATCSYG
jgi:hypothetical protein